MEGVETKKRSSFTWTGGCLGCFAASMVIFLIIGTVMYFGADAFLKYVIASDITEYTHFVKESDLEQQEKEPIIEKLVQLRSNAREGNRVSFWEWVDYDTSIRELIEDMEITSQELDMLLNELEELETH